MTQMFNVIFFSGTNVAPTQFDPRPFSQADAASKLAACDFAKNYSCHGQTHAMPALQSALANNPDMLYLVSDGDLDDPSQVLKMVREMNADKSTRINVIIISAAPTDVMSAYRALTTLAEETSGSCRVIDPSKQ